MYLDIIYAYNDAVGFTPAGSQVSRGAWTTTTYISSISTVEGSAGSILQTPDISSEYGHCWYCGVIKAGSFMQDATSDSTADNIYLEGIFIDETRSRSSVDNVGHVHVLEIDDAASGTTVERPVAQVYQPVQDAASSTTIDVVDVQKEGSYCTGEFELPLIKVDCDALIPPLIEGYFVLPCVDVAMTHIHTILVDGEFTLPALTWTADAQIGEITVGNFTLPSLSFAAETSPTITGEFALPLVEFDAEGTQGTTSTGTFALPILSVDISAPPRITGTFELPLLEIAATAWSQSITGSFVLPLLSVVGQTRWVSVAADTSTFVMNTDNAAITRYDTFNFNSYCIVDGKAYGANEDGIYLLDGDDDDDQPIVWEIETGVHDFMINAMKKIPDLYLTMRADGAVEVYVTSERAAESLYTLTMSSNTITKNNKVQVGRGHKGRKWQVKVASAAGIDFQLEEIIANVDVLAGKVW
jgi:hypothetical protein